MIPAVTGVGAVTAVGVGSTALLQAMKHGHSGIVGCSDRSDEMGRRCRSAALLDTFDLPVLAKNLGLSETVSTRLQLLLRRRSVGLQAAAIAAAEAWSMASADQLDPRRVGLIVSGSNMSNAYCAEEVTRRQVIPSYALRYCDFDHVGTISDLLDIQGEGYTAGAASASGGVAIALATRALASNAVDAMVVVGAPTMLSEVELEAFAKLGALSSRCPDDRKGHAICRPFDEDASGFVYGEGAAALVLERSGSSAAKAWLAGVSMNLDANQLSNPTLGGEVAVMQAALHAAGLSPEDIGLVNAHGSSSRLGDEVEAEAIDEVFGGGPVVNATKPIVGHCLGAAGVVEAVATVLQLDAGFAHGNINLTSPIRDLNFAGSSAAATEAVAAASNSFGFGGVNSSSVFVAVR